MTRIFCLRDPNIEIIYVAPYALPKEIISYYYKICELGELQNYKERIHFIWPENFNEFPSYFSTSKLLYYSPMALNRIKELIQNKTAYIVPSMPSREDYLIGIALNVPIFQGDLDKTLYYS